MSARNKRRRLQAEPSPSEAAIAPFSLDDGASDTEPSYQPDPAIDLSADTNFGGDQSPSSSEQSSASYWEERFADSPNRFHGPPHTYRTYIAEERDLYATIQQEEFEDLPRHLLAAHRLSTRHVDSTTQDDKGSPLSPSAAAIEGSRSENSFLSDRWWTAWPLEPLDVPRSLHSCHDEFISGRDITVTDHLPRNSFKALRDVLASTMLRAARKQWTLRQEELPTRKNANTISDMKVSSAQFRRARSIDVGTESDVAFGSSEGNGESQSGHSSVSRSSKPRSPTSEADAPVLSANEDASVYILDPLVCHVIAKLDATLDALHTSRYNQYGSAQGRRIDHKFEPSKSQPDVSEAPSSPSKGESSTSSRTDTFQRLPLQPRDWSEVLGLAAFAGLDSRVIHRATARCSALFGEGMEYTVLQNMASCASPSPKVAYLPNKIPSLQQLDAVEYSFQINGWSMDTLLCPHTGCKHSTEKLSNRRRMIVHLKQVHGWDPLADQPPLETIGGVHIDGFLQHIHRRAGWNVTNREGHAGSRSAAASFGASDDEFDNV